jgi:hypothetical protein
MMHFTLQPISCFFTTQSNKQVCDLSYFKTRSKIVFFGMKSKLINEIEGIYNKSYICI